MSEPDETLFDLGKHLPWTAGEGWRSVLREVVEWGLGISELRTLVRRHSTLVDKGAQPFESLCDLLAMTIDAQGVTESVPPNGPLVVISNHPYGGADALAVGTLVTRARDDVKILANAELMAMPGVRGYLLPLEILGEPSAARRNVGKLRAGLEHLQRGGALVAFPAGAISHWSWKHARVEDPPWPAHVARLVARTGAPVLPLWFPGRLGPLFQMLGACHPQMRTALICRGFLAMRNRTVVCQGGKLLDNSDLPSDFRELSGCLRKAVEAVSSGVWN